MIRIEAIEAFSDNYIWLLYDPDTAQAAVVDPGEAPPVEHALSDRDLQLAAILVTHHHFDHTGGIGALTTERRIPVIGPQPTDNPHITRRVADGDRFSVLGLDFEVIEVPGHTLDHIALVTRDIAPEPVLFCGDTLFAGGCGRLFEGDPPTMLKSLERLAALPADTRVYCAHEYTLANLAFARAVEPDNPALQQRQAEARAQREAGEPTVPSTLAQELATNPFLRCDQSAVKTAAESHSGQSCTDKTAVFATVRSWKDNF